MANRESSVRPEESEARARVGLLVVYFGVAGVLVIAATAITVGVIWGDDKKFGYAKDVLSTVLPVVAAWVGTVLAFFFSKENFVAAADKTAQLVGQLTPTQKLATILVTTAMIKIEDAKSFVLDKDEERVDVRDLVRQLEDAGRNRLPIVEPSGVVRYVVHRSLFDRFVATQLLRAQPPVGPQPPVGAQPPVRAQPPPGYTLTLAAMMAEGDYKRIVSAFGTVGPDAKLDTVKAQIDGNPDCSDAFVTADGGRGSRAIGWITNVIVAEKSKL